MTIMALSHGTPPVYGHHYFNDQTMWIIIHGREPGMKSANDKCKTSMKSVNYNQDIVNTYDFS